MQPLRLQARPKIEAAAGRPARISIVAYSGGWLRVGGWNRPLVVDLAGLELPASVTLLRDHTNEVGATLGAGRPEVSQGRLLVAGTLADVAAAAEVVAISKVCDLQASIGADPLEVVDVAAGEWLQVNGRTLQATEPSFLVARSVLREITITPMGADPTTSVSIAAKLQGQAMTFEEWALSEGHDLTTLTEEEVAKLREAYDAAQAQVGAVEARRKGTGTMPNTIDADAIRRQERERITEIDRICAGHAGLAELRTRAVNEGLPLDAVRAAALDTIRASRGSGAYIATGARASLGVDHLAAALLVRAGRSAIAEQAYGAAVMEQSRPLHGRSLVDLCASALTFDGREVPKDRGAMIRAALSTGSMPVALGNAANKALLQAYREAPQTWRSFAAVRPAADFKVHKSVRPSFLGSLESVASGGDIRHATLGESTFEWEVDTYAKMLTVDRRDIVNDDMGVFDEVLPSFGRMSAKSLSDLVYTTLLGAGSSYFDAGLGNVLSGGTSALSSTSLGNAVKQLRKQTAANGSALDLQPAVLLVPPELEMTARALLNSAELWRSTDATPTGNPLNGLAKLEVEPRLSNSAFSGYSLTAWYLFAAPQDVPLVVGFLDGRESPTVETFGFDETPNRLAMSWRVYHDYGVALGDYRAAQRSAGA